MKELAEIVNEIAASRVQPPLNAQPVDEAADKVELPTLSRKRGRQCSICKHPRRREIALAITTETMVAVAQRYGISYGQLAKHVKNHLKPQSPAQIGRDMLTREALREGWLSKVEDLRKKSMNALEAAKTAGEMTGALGAVTRILRMQGEALHELAAAGTINLNVTLKELGTGSLDEAKRLIHASRQAETESTESLIVRAATFIGDQLRREPSIGPDVWRAMGVLHREVSSATVVEDAQPAASSAQ